MKVELVRQELRQKAGEALGRLDEMAPFVLEPPLRLEVGFLYTRAADRTVNIPGVERTGGRSIATNLDSVEAASRLLIALTSFL